MPVYISGRYWPFIIVFGYTLRDLTVNLLSNDLSIGLDRNSSVIQRIVIYVAMLAVAIICSTVIEFLQKQQCPQREVVTSGRHIVDILGPETQHADLAHLTFTQPEVLSQHITQLHGQAGDLYHTEVPSRSAGITEPEALGQTEDLSQTRVHSQPPRSPETEVPPDLRIDPRLTIPQALPGTQDVLQSDDFPQTQVVSPSSDIPEPQALPQNETLLQVEDLPHTGVRSKSLSILTPQVVPQIEKLLSVEDLPLIEVPRPFPDIPGLQVFPQAGDLPHGEDLSQIEVRSRSPDIPEPQTLLRAVDLLLHEEHFLAGTPSRSPDISKLQALFQTEDLPLAEELPRTEDQPRHTGDIPEDLFPQHYSTFQEGSARRRTRNIIELDGGPGRGKSIINSFLEVKAWTDRQAVELFEIKVIKIFERDLGASHKSPDQDPSASPRGPLDPEVAAMFSEDLDY